jgi:hypothetical protein
MAAHPVHGFSRWMPVAGLLLAAEIAWFTPFDRAFDAATFGIPAVRAVMIVALALAGAATARQLGLGVASRDLRRPIVTPVLVAAAVAGACGLADGLMRPQVPPSVLGGIATIPLPLRTFLFMLRAFNENILYRLFLGSVFVWLIGRVWKGDDGRPASGAFWLGFTASQAVNVWINVTSLAPVTPMALVHDAIRYVGPGLVWSRLYWKHGFQSNEIACTSVHLFLQPLLTLEFA